MKNSSVIKSYHCTCKVFNVTNIILCCTEAYISLWCLDICSCTKLFEGCTINRYRFRIAEDITNEVNNVYTKIDKRPTPASALVSKPTHGVSVATNICSL